MNSTPVKGYSWITALLIYQVVEIIGGGGGKTLMSAFAIYFNCMNGSPKMCVYDRG